MQSEQAAEQQDGAHRSEKAPQVIVLAISERHNIALLFVAPHTNTSVQWSTLSISLVEVLIG